MNRPAPHRCLALLTLAALLVAAGPAFAGAGSLAREAFPERSLLPFDKAAAADQLRVRHGFLTAHQNTAALESPVVVTLTAEELAQIDPRAELRQRVGLVKDLSVAVDLTQAGGFGVLRASRNSFVWTGAVRSPGAAALRLHFSDVTLPDGVELYVYSSLGEAFGPFTGRGPSARGDFWANTITGDEALVQLHYTGTDAAAARRATHLTLAGVGHMTDAFRHAVSRKAALLGDKSFCSFNASCIQNASCGSLPSAVNTAQDAIALLNWISGAFIYTCSGGLIADTDASTQIPYLLTANHCLSKNTDAGNVEAFFQFTTPCNGSCYDPDGVVPSTLGSSIVATNRTGDYTLLQLSQPAPAGSAFMGWTSAPVAFTSGVNLYRISHPGGAPQAYSQTRVDTAAGTCRSWPRGSWIYSENITGSTEGGSSGSPVVNSSGQVVGQLSGACGFDVNNTCNFADNSTVDGAFASYFTSVAQYLDPGTSCTDADADGFCSDVDCDDSNASVNPGATEACGDGIDNNCNGTVDEGCGVCLPAGSSCVNSSDCCSNNCKGKTGSKTCK